MSGGDDDDDDDDVYPLYHHHFPHQWHDGDDAEMIDTDLHDNHTGFGVQ